jgi:hypothetical protein
MRLGVLLGWGIVIYAVVRLALSIMGAYGWTQGVVPQFIAILVMLLICTVAGSALKFRSWKDILPYSIGWALVAVFFDVIFAAASGDWVMFSEWSAWLNYALVALFPLCAIFFAREHPHGGVWET